MGKELVKEDIRPNDTLGKIIYRILKRYGKTRNKDLMRMDYYLAIRYKINNPNVTIVEIAEYLTDNGFPMKGDNIDKNWYNPSLTQLVDAVRLELYNQTDVTWKIPDLLGLSFDHLIRVMKTPIDEYEKLGYTSAGQLARHKDKIATSYIIHMIPRKLDLSGTITTDKKVVTMADVVSLLNAGEYNENEQDIIEGEITNGKD